MSEWHVRVVEIGEIKKHENADTLSITRVDDYPVIIRTGTFKPGDRAVYVPVDSIVPTTDERFAFLKDKRKIKAIRLRGVFSMGLLVDADNDMQVGDIVAERMGIVKYEPPLPKVFLGGSKPDNQEKDPGFLPVYTDIEGLRKFPDVLEPGEWVVLTEKIHGANGRWLFKDGRLWVGSHKCIWKEDEGNIWWKIARKYNLEEKLSEYPDIVIYGEVYGKVQNLRYGLADDIDLVLFDAMAVDERKYFDYSLFADFAFQIDVPIVPLLSTCRWDKEFLSAYSNGKTTLNADHTREGYVVRPVEERFDDRVGRVILKRIGEDYLLQKGKR